MRSGRAICRSGSPTAPTIRERRTSARGSVSLPRDSPTVHAVLDPDRRLLIEYKPFEPAFYHTDIADWGMALLLARRAGPQAKVLVDTGHHYASQNIEQIVAWLLDEGMLGGFHFNDRRYARRRPDARVDRSVPGVSHLSRDPVLRMAVGRARRHRLRHRSEPQPQRQDRGDDPDRRHGAGRSMPRPRSSTTSGWPRRNGPPISSPPSGACRMRSRPTCGRRSRNGEHVVACRRIRWTRFEKADTSIASRRNARPVRAPGSVVVCVRGVS